MPSPSTATATATHLTNRSGFLADPVIDEQVAQLYQSDLSGQGYVANLTRVWANSPEALTVLSFLLKRAAEAARLDGRQRSLLTAATARAIDDSYCSMAFGTALARVAGDEVAAGVIAGDDTALTEVDRTLAGWAKRVAASPNDVTADDVDALRTLGYDDGQIFSVTLFVALRKAFSTVNDALGAAPDAELVERAPAAVRAAVTYGRPPAT